MITRQTYREYLQGQIAQTRAKLTGTVFLSEYHAAKDRVAHLENLIAKMEPIK